MTLRRPLVSLALLAQALARGCGLCGNEVVSDVRSPDGKLRAVLFRRDCGATADWTLHISILGSSDPFPEGEGNLFRAENDGKIPPRDVKVAWDDSRHLLVRFSPRLRIYHESAALGTIRIRYEALTP